MWSIVVSTKKVILRQYAYLHGRIEVHNVDDVWIENTAMDGAASLHNACGDDTDIMRNPSDQATTGGRNGEFLGVPLAAVAPLRED